MTDDDWVLTANKKEDPDRIYRYKGTNVFKLVEREFQEDGLAVTDQEIFKIVDPDHSIWSELITAREAADYPASKEIYNDQSKRYLSLNLREGYIILEGDRVDFQVSDLDDSDKAKLVADEI